MSNPSFYNRRNLGKVYQPDLDQVIQAGRKTGWKPSAQDSKTGKRVCLWIVDPQIDFCHPDGKLPVAGALDDIDRICNLIFEQGDRISSIVVTIDTHSQFMIFFPIWWVNAQGQHPAPYTVITEDDIRKGTWRARFEPSWSHSYPTRLAQKGKKQLMIWPYHCIDGTVGINIVPPLLEAIMYHGAARSSQPVFVHKGQIPKVEFYSPLEPEISVPDIPGGTLNTHVLGILEQSDILLVAGEAKSHCVLEAMHSAVNHLPPDVVKRIIFLTDCTSSVAHPQVDFEALANSQIKDMVVKHGIRLAKSTEVSL